MSSPQPFEGGRPLLRGRVFGFPVHLDLSFIVVMGILGYLSVSSVRGVVIWLLITPFSVLIHELGHAFVARTTGARPQIALAGFGGVTTYVPPRPLSRGRSLAISLAGPGVGLVAGGLLLALAAFLEAERGSWQALALAIGVWTCIGWSVLNLLPILPLDGGQALRELLPGDPQVREVRAAYVSIVVAVVAGIVAYTYFGQPFVAFFLAFFALSNVMTVRAASPGQANRPRPATPEQQVIDELWHGRPAQARDLLAARAETDQVDPALHGAVLALTGDRAQGHAVLEQEISRRPDDVAPVALLGLTLTLEHDWDGLVALMQGPRSERLPRSVLDRAIDEARGTGREDVAGRLTQLAS